jgi:hypothetical protein
MDKSSRVQVAASRREAKEVGAPVPWPGGRVRRNDSNDADAGSIMTTSGGRRKALRIEYLTAKKINVQWVCTRSKYSST